MPRTEPDSPFIYSSLGADPDLGDLVEMFVNEMPDKIQVLQDQANRHDWNQLARAAHQLKGAAGSYGFDQITPYAKELEHVAREGTAEERILAALDRVIDLCDRARSGAAE